MPEGGNHFSSVKKARAALREKALETYNTLLAIINGAAAKGDFETAAKYTWLLLEHTPKEDGEAVIDESASKPKHIDNGHRGPVVQIIGLKLSGIDPPQLPEPSVTIDVQPIDPTSDK